MALILLIERNRHAALLVHRLLDRLKRRLIRCAAGPSRGSCRAGRARSVPGQALSAGSALARARLLAQLPELLSGLLCPEDACLLLFQLLAGRPDREVRSLRGVGDDKTSASVPRRLAEVVLVSRHEYVRTKIHVSEKRPKR